MKGKVTFFLLSHCLVSEGDKHFFWLIRLVSKVTYFALYCEETPKKTLKKTTLQS